MFIEVSPMTGRLSCGLGSIDPSKYVGGVTLGMTLEVLYLV